MTAVGQAYETKPTVERDDVVLVVAPCPPGAIRNPDHECYYCVVASLLDGRQYLFNDGMLDQWYRRIA